MAELESGRSLASRFTLIRHLGRGGMGEAWLARDENLGTRVVTKMVPAGATDQQISLLRQECRNARRLSHPNIVRVFDFHRDPTAIFITMEYVEGGNVGDLRGQDPKQILTTLLPLVEALEYAHGEGVVHRDLKCGNVLLDQQGRPRLTDFGIAAVIDPDAEDLVLTGGGSRNHTSPQQQAGEPASPADDIYGLGALLLDLLGSSAPLPEELSSLLRSMVADDVEQRPAAMQVVRKAIEEMVETTMNGDTLAPQVSSPPIRLSPPPRVNEVREGVPIPVSGPSHGDSDSRRRHPYWWLTVAAFVTLAAVAVGVFVLLPDWVEDRGSSTGPEGGAIESEVVATPPPVESVDPALEESPAETPEARVIEEVTPVEQRKPPITRPVAERSRPAQTDSRTREFARAMTDGLEALESGEVEAAKGAFERALSLDPASVEAADGLVRAQGALRLAAIREHQAKALTLESQELWHDAESQFAAALALDSTLRFAREGKDRAAARASLHDKLEYHIAHPDRLSEDSVLAEARQILASAREIEPGGPKLRGQIDRLRGVIEIATTPVRVLLLSDNLTNIVVYKVGRMGTFERRTLDLRPGTYTVVGTREGYRDVRRQLRVVATGEIEPLTVRCEEEI